MRRRAIAGFTQMEILIVLAIIVILALILFPVISRARENARQSSCLANVRQIVSALSMYAQDHDEALMADPLRQSWSSQLSIYNEAAIYHCPTKGRSANIQHPDYGFNHAMFSVNIADISEPDSTVLVADLRPSVNRANFAFADPDRDIDLRHSHGVTVGFADGHVNHISIVGRDVYEQFVALGLRFTPDNSPLPWKVIATGGGDTVNLSGRGSRGFFILNGTTDFPCQRPGYATSWNISAFGKHTGNAASGWSYAGANEGCTARLICRDNHLYTGACWTTQSEENSISIALTTASDDQGTHQVTLWTPWCHPNLDPRDEYVVISGSSPDQQVSYTLDDLRYSRGAFVTISFTGPIIISISSIPPAGENSTMSFGALLFD